MRRVRCVQFRIISVWLPFSYTHAGFRSSLYRFMCFIWCFRYDASPKTVYNIFFAATVILDTEFITLESEWHKFSIFFPRSSSCVRPRLLDGTPPQNHSVRNHPYSSLSSTTNNTTITTTTVNPLMCRINPRTYRSFMAHSQIKLAIA